ncbi:hypothetical protein FB451DRAFT_1396211 [Mycena latifolia]|nr:hypothetical protein FB451DRAFT_1396211 [Mycena latifolia]
MATNTGLKTCVIPSDGVNLVYNGSVTLTISPTINGGVLNPGDNINIPANDTEYKFNFKVGTQTTTVAKILYRAGDGSATITGSTAMAGTGPFIRFYPIAALRPDSIGAVYSCYKNLWYLWRSRQLSPHVAPPQRALSIPSALISALASHPPRAVDSGINLTRVHVAITVSASSYRRPRARQIRQSHWRHPEGSFVIQIHRSGAFFLGTSIFGLMHAYAPKLIIFIIIFRIIALDVVYMILPTPTMHLHPNSYKIPGRRPTLPLNSYTLLNSMATYVWCYMANLISPTVLIFPRTMSRTALDRFNA